MEGGQRYLEYFEGHGYELIEKHIEYDSVNRYFRPISLIVS